MLKVVGHRILVRPDPVEKPSDIIEIVSDEKLDKANQTYGTVVGIGEDAYKAFRLLDDQGTWKNGRPWVNAGDRIIYSRFAGKSVEDPSDKGVEYKVLNDDDVIAIIIEDVNDD